MEKKLTPIAKAVKEINKERVRAKTIGGRRNNDIAFGMSIAIRILKEQKPYEAKEYASTFDSGWKEGYNDGDPKEKGSTIFDGSIYFEEHYTQEGGQG